MVREQLLLIWWFDDDIIMVMKVFHQLGVMVGLALNEASLEMDFASAKQLLNMSFTFYHTPGASCRYGPRNTKTGGTYAYTYAYNRSQPL